MEKVIFDETFIKEIDGRKLSLFTSDNLYYLKTDYKFSRVMKKIENEKKEKIIDDDRREDFFLSYLKDLIMNKII